ncbi:DUF4189 domain-containing protein [Dapis sp. BLCC M126]|uniref:DUF4189 domain-containing protein n=1 Tax=Dapis sp. BLCC M126 TaxID=3400189 RepID=UPI003CEAF528
MNILLKPTKLIKYSLMAFIIGTSVVVSHQEKAWAGYGAISYSPSQKTNGISNNKVSQDSAVEEAKQDCEKQGGKNCKTRWVRNGCVVLMVNSSNAQYSFGSGISLSSAENDAKNNCQECEITRYLCTSN